MRITQSMLVNNMVRNLSNSNSKLDKIQNQIDTKKRINRPSDDPVAIMRGIGYHRDVDKIDQYKEKNLGEVNNWLDNSDAALDAVGIVLHRVHYIVGEAANGTKTEDDRAKYKIEIDELKKHLQSISNTQMGGKYIFNGTNTLTPVWKDGVFSNETLPGPPPVPPSAPGWDKAVNIEVTEGTEMTVNVTAVNMFKDLDTMMQNIGDALVGTPGNPSNSIEISALIKSVTDNLDVVLEKRAELGARQNRAEMMENRLSSQNISTIKMMDDNEGTDYEKAISELMLQETSHRASLAVGARIIQPSLVDFLR
ncbi:flagellar hook-associated protein FlgL [Sporosarcina limicola]|uniref:Flagellar hook-associated protein 3 FlgL n=1 Tax=Sporosarcina limicola TaxID=34101 RepID=A0A927MIH2_9BACL|nr:flagellar hook-associated protein FlgL [Sporosarcina limicola]MBE1555010.1 flagellar hook-associated protein 3 FlgL [Sporosarcina limicola]